LPQPGPLVATLISNPLKPCITPALIEDVARAIGTGVAVRVLSDGIAVDLAFEDAAPAGSAAQLREALADAAVDIVVQPMQARRKRLFLADMDSTMIEQECIDELADFVGLKAEVSLITERAMRGEIAFEPALRERVALLAGLPVAVVERILRERITLMPGGRTLLATLGRAGVYTCLVSGGFTVFTGPVATILGFHEHRSNRLVLSDETLAGTIEEPILGREAKLATLIELRERHGLDRTEVLAVGDGANDLAMLGEAGLGVAFRAKPSVAAAAHARSTTPTSRPSCTARATRQTSSWTPEGRLRPSRSGRPKPLSVAAYSIETATKRTSPCGFWTSSRADLRPSFLSASTRRVTSAGEATAS
jgi:phosphoserine phosphatase